MKTSKSAPEKSGSELGVEKGKDDADLDMESFEMGSDYMTLPNESERAAKKMAARRKIELYWEKKRLQEQLGDFNDEELDF